MPNWLKFYLICLLIVPPGISVAQSNLSKESSKPVMSEVVVTATRAEQNVERIPANVSVITGTDIQNSTAKTIPDLLRYEEGIVVRDFYGNGKNVNLDLRGFGETGQYNNLVLVDGRRVNAIDLSGVDWTQIPLDQIERIEIVRGTGTVLYGDNASGGVINIITKTPPVEPYASVAASVGSYQFKKGSVSVGGGSNHIKGSLNVSYEDTDGYRDNNHFRAGDVGGKIIYDLSDDFGLNLSGSYHNDDYGLPGPLTENQLSQNRKQTQDSYFDDGQSTDQYLNLGANWEMLEYGSIVMDLSYRKSDSESMFRGTWPFLQKNDKKTWGFTPRYLWEGEWLRHNHTLISGVDYYTSDYHLANFSGASLPQSGYADSDKRSIGFYVNDEISISNDLTISLGARYESVKYDLNQMDTWSGTLDDSVSKDAYAYDLGLTYLYRKDSSMFARVNRSFRFPLADEMVETVEIAPWTYQLSLNSDLKPQTGLHYEAGIRHQFSHDILAKMTLFRADITDEILLDKITYAPFGENVNHPGTVHQGVEVGCMVETFKKISIHGNYTYQKATFEKQPHKGNDIPGVPGHKGNLGLSIGDIIPKLVITVDYNYVGSSFAVSDLANQYKKLDAYHTVDVKFDYTYKIMKAFFGIKNLTDQKYSEYAIIGGTPTGVNYYPAPERNFLAGVDFMF